MMDIYPSTDDVRPEAVDDVIACIEEAGRRYQEGGRGGTYLGIDAGQVVCCAVGSLMLADGITVEDYRSEGNQGDWIEQHLSATAKMAMAVLDEVVAEEWPQAAELASRPNAYDCMYFGPLEALNERFGSITGWDRHRRRPEMARIYALAVERLRAQKPEIKVIDERELALV